MKRRILSRRQFLCSTSVGLASAGMASSPGFGSIGHSLELGAGPPSFVPNSASATAESLDLNALRSFHIWDGHCHLEGFEGATGAERMADALRFADRMAIERMCIFLGFPFNFHGTAEDMRLQNAQVLDAVSHSGGRAFGYVYLNPNYPEACLEQIDRYVRDGPMIGMKFELGEHQGADTPVMDTLISRAAELPAVVMHHTWIKTTGNEEGESTPMDLARLARRHPSVTIFCGHTGGNWELGIRAIREVSNLYSDLCGSDPTAGFTEMAVRELGPERVLYGSDVGGRSFASQLGKVMGADLTDSTRRLILGENLRRLLQPILKAKGVK